MRASFRVSVVHVVTGKAEDLIRAEVAFDHGRGGAAQIARCSGRASIAAV